MAQSKYRTNDNYNRKRKNQSRKIFSWICKKFAFFKLHVTAELGRPAVKIKKVSKNVPNTLTLKIMKETEEGKNLTKTTSHKDLMEKLEFVIKDLKPNEKVYLRRFKKTVDEIKSGTNKKEYQSMESFLNEI